MSRFGRSFSILRVPYSLKLLIQELQVMNVQMHIITDDNVDQLLSMSYSSNINKLTNTTEFNDNTLKTLAWDINKKLKETKPIENKYEAPVIPEPIVINKETETETNDIISSPAYAPGSPAYTPVYAPGSPEYAPGSPAYARGSPAYDLNNSNISSEQSIPYSPIIQEFGKQSSEQVSVETPENQSILEVETIPKEENNDENITENSNDDSKKIITSELNEESSKSSNSGETKKIIL